MGRPTQFSSGRTRILRYIFKIGIKVIVIPKGESVNEDSDDDSDDAENDTGDLSLHDGGGGFHNTWFDVDYLSTDQNNMGTSRTKLPVHRNMETDGVEPDRRGGVSVEGVSEPPEGGILMAEGGSEPVEGVTQPPERVNRTPEGACELSDALLLLAACNSGEPSNERISEASDSTFGDGLDLHEGRFFISKKELMNKLTDVAFKENF